MGEVEFVSVGQPIDQVAVEPPAPEYAGFWIRFAARLIDTLVIYALAFVTAIIVVVVSLAIASASGSDTAPVLAHLRQQSFFGFLASFVASVAFWTLFEGIHGSTPGKLATGLTVLCQDGSFCSLGSALVRSLVFFVDSLFFGLPAFLTMRNSPNKQRMGDKLARTVVVRRRSLLPSQKRPGGRLAAAFLAAFTVYSAVIAVGQIIKL